MISHDNFFPSVELRAAKIPYLGYLALHYWYVVIENQNQSRWEVWQQASLISTSWGHLHQNLLPLEAGVGNGASWVANAWTGETAGRLIEVIYASPQTYPYKFCYRYFPGPNSNTYAQWVLAQAKIAYPLGRKAIGKEYLFLAQLLGK